MGNQLTEAEWRISKLSIIDSDNLAYRLVPAKPLSEPMLEYFNWTLGNNFQWKKMFAKWWPFCRGLHVLNEMWGAVGISEIV